MKLLINNYDYAKNIQCYEYSFIVLRNYFWQEYIKINFLIVCVSARNNSYRAFPFEDKQHNTFYEDSRYRKIGKPINFIQNTRIEDVSNHKHKNRPYYSVQNFQSKEFPI